MSSDSKALVEKIFERAEQLHIHTHPHLTGAVRWAALMFAADTLEMAAAGACRAGRAKEKECLSCSKAIRDLAAALRKKTDG